jgi:uncharacterized membrane protein YphA (DoxX/SURF4 family)
MKHARESNAHAMAFLRIAVGALFLVLAQYKIFSGAFVHGGFESWVHGLLRSGSAYPFVAPVLQNVVLTHAEFFAFIVAYGELAIGLGLVLGALVTPVSTIGFIYMLTLLFSTNYPGAHAAPWEYLSASLNHLVLAICFLTFILGEPENAWSVQIQFRTRQ